jgi:hypothetical protein|tara:strand:+ start:226 stop:471 length:246 start_codon:yes stop_codon:yes gene_type:complete
MKTTFPITLLLDTEKFGSILACIDYVAHNLNGSEKEFLLDLSDEIRSSQKQFLGSMAIKDGLELVKNIQEIEKKTLNKLNT